MKKTTEQLKNEIAEARRKIEAIENMEFEKTELPRLKKMVGKHFVYRGNTYGGNSGRWDVFRVILDFIERDGSYIFIYKETTVDCYGSVKIETGNHSVYTNRRWWGSASPFSGFVPVAKDEYERNARHAEAEIEEQSKMRKYLAKKD